MYKQKPPIFEFIGIDETEYFDHYGTKRHSGRFPYGSGDNPYQHEKWGVFLSRIDELKADGWTETPENIKKAFGEEMTTSQYRKEKAWAEYKNRLYLVQTAERLKTKGCEENGWQPMTNKEVAEKMGLAGESSVRSLLDTNKRDRMMETQVTADNLKKIVDSKNMVDVGSGSAQMLGINENKFKNALYLLEKEGYHIYKCRVPNATNEGAYTTMTVLATPDTMYKEVYEFDKIGTLKEYKSHDGGETISTKEPLKYPKSMDSSRLEIRYREQGGIDKDGTIEIRRGVKDLALTDSTGKGNESSYAQVRILVDGTHYIKGMAVYSDNLPKGKDIIFNTNKKIGTPMTDVLKEIKDDPSDPFGSLIKEQNYYISKDGKKTQGLINYRAIEGDWSEWKDSLPSQFLSKQSTTLAKKQLNLAKESKANEFKSIQNINNPVIRKYYLKSFAEDCDSAAVHLSAAALPGQHYQVLLALPSLKETEVYAPNYKDGIKLALVRYPHGGTFEIPILTVNNRNRTAKQLLGNNPKDAVMVNSKVAERLSGADFDGDTVMCIPTHNAKSGVKITSKPALKDLENYDPKDSYGCASKKKDSNGVTHYYDGAGYEYPLLGKTATQRQMGEVTNLINDMTLGGASDKEIARAVKHSMTIIDANKHHLNYKLSEAENDIASLKAKYQTGGASTIISRAKSPIRVAKTQGEARINIKGKDYYDSSRPEGALISKLSDDLYEPVQKYDKKTKKYVVTTTDGRKITYDPTDKGEVKAYAPVKSSTTPSGKKVYGPQITNADGTLEYRVNTRTQETHKMLATDDAYTLVSPGRTAMELVYADYANSMKAMANQARKEYATTSNAQTNTKAKKTYANEVASLTSKLNTALKNAPIERQAQRMAATAKAAKEKEAKTKGEILTKQERGKIAQKSINKYREEYGAVKRRDRYIPITDREWEAIQAGAVSSNVLNKILNNTDPDELRERATPKENVTVSSSMIARIKSLSNSNYTQDQIARMLGISTSTVSKYAKE